MISAWEKPSEIWLCIIERMPEIGDSGLTDPFAHHPELRGKIADPAEADFFRTFDAAAFFADKPDLHWVLDLLHSDDERERIRRKALAAHEGGDLWVFAYGSLMWNPAMHFAEIRRATLPGYSRKFILFDIYGGRGTREAPGLMAALDHGERCEGLLFRVREEDIEAETEILWRREIVGPGYLPVFLTADVDGVPVRSLTFTADHSAEAIRTDLSFKDQVRLISQGSGFLGSSRDYLANIVNQFEALGIHDEECVMLLEAVDSHIAATGAARSKERPGPVQ